MGYVSDNWQFFVDFPEGTEEITIGNDSIKWKFEKNKDYGFMRRTLDTRLLFVNTSSVKAYDRIHALDQDRTFCTPLNLNVKVRYDHINWLDYADFEIPLRSGKKHRDKCEIERKVRPKDVFQCLLENHKVKKNLLLAPNKVQLQFIQGEIQEHVCTNLAPASPPIFSLSNIPVASCEDITAAEGWTITKNVLNGVAEKTGYPIPVFCAELSIVTTYKREFVAAVDSPGPDWIAVTGGYVRPINTVFLPYDENNPTTTSTDLLNFPGSGRTEIVQRYKTVGFNNDDNEIDSFDNGIPLESAIDYILDGCGLTIISNFFGINPDGTAPVNVAYEYANEYCQEIILFQASDIIRASALNNATRLEMSFFELWNNLKRFNVEMIAVDDTTVRIEHISYRKQSQELSVLGDLFKHVKGNSESNYNEEKTPRAEYFKDKYDTFGPDFDNASIIYDASCSTDSDEDPPTMTSPNTVCNIDYLYNNVLISQDTEKMVNTIVMVSTKNLTVLSAPGAITNTPGLNRAMAMANVIQSCWLWRRPQASGLVNGVQTEFYTYLPIEEQEKLIFTYCLEDFVTKFNASDQIQTQLGWCEIESAEYTSPPGDLEVSPIK